MRLGSHPVGWDIMEKVLSQHVRSPVALRLRESPGHMESLLMYALVDIPSWGPGWQPAFSVDMWGKAPSHDSRPHDHGFPAWASDIPEQSQAVLATHSLPMEFGNIRKWLFYTTESKRGLPGCSSYQNRRFLERGNMSMFRCEDSVILNEGGDFIVQGTCWISLSRLMFWLLNSLVEVSLDIYLSDFRTFRRFWKAVLPCYFIPWWPRTIKYTLAEPSLEES